MNSKQELEIYINEHLSRRNYSERTKDMYSYWILKLADYYGKYSASDFEDKDISDFIKHLEDRQGLSASTIKQAANSLHFYFNTLSKKILKLKLTEGSRLEESKYMYQTKRKC